MKCFYLGCLLFLSCTNNSFSQDSLYARKIINTLCSKAYHGRGYVKQGDGKAAAFLSSEFKRLGIPPIAEQYYQSFQFPVNTFPGAMQVMIDGKKLVAGADFIVSPSSASGNHAYDLEYVDSTSLIAKLSSPVNSCLVITMKDFNSQRETAAALLSKKQTGAIILLEETKLTWSVAQYHYAIPVIVVLKKRLAPSAKNVSFHFRSVFQESHSTQNIGAIIKGTSLPDSFIVFSAHYDHLGMMGRHTRFPGANDNASGTAMLFNLAKYYSQPDHKPRCSLVFISFAGEEAGLVGSKYFTEHPLLNLKKIKFLINLDLLGTGDEGMMVVNATAQKKEFSLLKNINAEKQYLSTIGERGNAHNSDHYYFSEKGVPAFFFYTMGGIQAYHDIYDKAETLPLTKFKEVFRLIRDFTDEL